jgi:CheY-like chemotaxis protein
MEYAIDVALAAGVKQLALFHHDPTHDDDLLDRLVDVCRRRVALDHGALEVFAAAEGQAITLSEGESRPSAGALSTGSMTVDVPPEESIAGATVLVVDDEPDIVNLLWETLAPEGYRLLSAHDGETALRLARRERPSLLLLDWRMPGQDGLDVVRALRHDPDPELRRVPVVLLTAQLGDENISVGFSAGVTDYLTKPFRPAHVRARVRGWLLRSRQGAVGGDSSKAEVP